MGLITDLVKTLKVMVKGGSDDGADDHLTMGIFDHVPSKNLGDKGFFRVPVGGDGQLQWDGITLYDENEYDDEFDVKIKTHCEKIENGTGKTNKKKLKSKDKNRVNKKKNG